jgi:hypothetical protein
MPKPTSNVFLVESLGYNLLSVSQLCHMGYNCLFTNVDVSVFRRTDGSLAFKGVLDGKLYLVDFSKENADLDAFLIAKTCWGLVLKCFGLTEGKKYKCDARANISQPEQYGGTVHLFIGT